MVKSEQIKQYIVQLSYGSTLYVFCWGQYNKGYLATAGADVRALQEDDALEKMKRIWTEVYQDDEHFLKRGRRKAAGIAGRRHGRVLVPGA